MDDDNGDSQRRVLRARIGVRWPVAVDRSVLEERVAAAIRTVVDEMGGDVDVLQLDLAAHPSWTSHGPEDRITGRHLNQPADSTDDPGGFDDARDRLD